MLVAGAEFELALVDSAAMTSTPRDRAVWLATVAHGA
jgi:hypothetical protein